MAIDLEAWAALFQSNEQSDPDLIAGYLEFLKRCEALGIPPIFEDRHLAALIGVPFIELVNLRLGSVPRYRTFSIPKRSGGHREIKSPYPLLLVVQQWLLKEIFYKIAFPPHAHGGVPGRSTITNARVHLGAACVLRMDLKGFFDNIHRNVGARIFLEYGYPPSVAGTLSSLCFDDNRLPQGAATSSAISNLVAAQLDNRLSSLAEKFNLRYTRYVDDITFSGDFIGVRFSDIAADIVTQAGFIVNPDKTILARGASPKIVTGLSVGGSHLRVPRSFRRTVKNQAFQLLKRGAERHALDGDVSGPLFVEVTLGRLAYWRQVEPDSQTAISLFSQVDHYRRTLLAEGTALPDALRVVPIAAANESDWEGSWLFE